MDLVIIFETHSTSVDNEAGIASGWHDAPLSTTGEQQARELGRRRSGDDVTVVFSSDLSRAFRTAEIAFGARGIPLVRDARLRECNYGALTQTPASEIEAHRIDHLRRPYPDGESLEQVSARVAEWLDETARRFAGTVVVVGHRATFYAFEHLIRQNPARRCRWRTVALAARVGLPTLTAQIPPFQLPTPIFPNKGY